MIFNKHGDLEGKHAFLSASKYHWINYDHEKLRQYFDRYLSAQRGTELHDFARQCIKLQQRLPRSKRTLNAYVNDAIGYSMTPEQVLYYSENCFGTADAISFEKDFLRIHDLKTGEVVPAHMEQLEIYAAIFCLEYNKSPYDISIELRIYQNDDVRILQPQPEDIAAIMETIQDFDNEIDRYRMEE